MTPAYCPTAAASDLVTQRRRSVLAQHGYDTTPADVFRLLDQSAATAGITGGFDAVIGPVVTRFRFAGTALAAAVTLPFHHLAVQPGEDAPPALSVDLVQSAALEGVPSAPAPWGLMVDDGNARRFHDWRPETDLVLDCEAARIVGRMDDPARWRADQIARPLHRLLGGALSGAGAVMLHAALIGEDGDAVLLTGAGGSGKSTTALACLFAGLDVLGDDTVAVRPSADGITGYSLFSTGLADPAFLVSRGVDCDRFAPTPIEGETKMLWHLNGVPRHNRVVAIVLPKVGSPGPSITERARGGDFLRATAAHSTFVNIQDRGLAMDVMTLMAQSLPIWRLSLGDDPAEVGRAVRSLIRHPHHGGSP